jgi:hypothetical protein
MRPGEIELSRAQGERRGGGGCARADDKSPLATPASHGTFEQKPVGNRITVMSLKCEIELDQRIRNFHDVFNYNTFVRNDSTAAYLYL